jgi:hypothetical protein
VPRRMFLAVSALTAGALLASACGGSSTKDTTATASLQSTTPPKTTVATSPAKTPTAASTTASTPAAVSSAAAETPASSVPPTSGGKTYTEIQAKTLLDDASLKPTDVGPDWLIMADTLTDNAAAAVADPTSAASNERCGRLAGRLLTNSPKDTVSAYLGGTIVAAFSQITAYATAAGAADCAAEAAVRFQKPGELARAFGTVFVNPDAVVVKPVDYPQVGDGSLATALTGDINAAGTVVQLQIVFVAFLKGNVSAVVGVAYAPLTNPSTTELKPFVDLVLQRITANQ